MPLFCLVARAELALFCLVVLAGANSKYPTNIKARVTQREDFGSKLKVSYNINSPESTPVHLCAGCTISINTGERTSSEGYMIEGSTCGGHPSGCATIKRADWLFNLDSVALAFRVGGEGKLWSTDDVQFSLKAAVKGQQGVVKLTQQVTSR